MRGKKKFIIPAAGIFAIVVIVVFIVSQNQVPILQPQGEIADQQRDLMIFATLLMLIVVVPVYFLTFWIAWRYRASNTKAKYSPNLAGNRWLEAIWWAVPIVIIAILAVVTWQTSHQLDPFKQLESHKKPTHIQVVALQWRWLFIYPEEKIATVNYVAFPEKTPINFDITSDAPMNSFWIPSLGGQIYAMSGMNTKLHLSAHAPGVYRGSSANISGKGFANMKFKAESMSSNKYKQWVQNIKKSDAPKLDKDSYEKLAKPSRSKDVLHYKNVSKDLYDSIIMKYMHPKKDKVKHDQMDNMDDMDMSHMEGHSH